jgi:vacuolar-type H+-ATPase subunit I/STV1
MKVKISYLLSLLSGIVATVSIFLTYASVKVVGYDTGTNYNGLDLRDLFRNIGGDWFNGLAEYAIIFILIFGICTIVYSIVLMVMNDKVKNVPMNFFIDGAILLILVIVVIVRVTQVHDGLIGTTGLTVGYGLYVAIVAAILSLAAGVAELRMGDKTLNRS